MKRKNDTTGLLFSAFMVTAFVVCSYFFIGIIETSTALGGNDALKLILRALVCVLFGGILFYATRIGDGKQVKRFSLLTLIIMVLPALYIILAAAAPGLPFPLELTKYPEVVSLAGVALGYGIPYTFLSGYELEREETEETEETDEAENEQAADDNSQPSREEAVENSGSEKTDEDEKEDTADKEEADKTESE